MKIENKKTQSLFINHACQLDKPKTQTIMLRWTITFVILALIAAVLGFGGIAAGAAGIAKVLFFIFLILFVVSLISGRKKI